jgi:hypothetical protein
VAEDDTKFSSQSLDRRSFNDTYGMYEHIAYEDKGNGTVGAINPSEEAILLRRLVKIMESQANTDSSLRQRVVVEAIQGTALGRSMTGLDSLGGVAAPNFVTAAAPGPATGATYFQPVWVGPVDQRFQIMDQARNAYANGIRNNLSFS